MLAGVAPQMNVIYSLCEWRLEEDNAVKEYIRQQVSCPFPCLAVCRLRKQAPGPGLLTKLLAMTRRWTPPTWPISSGTSPLERIAGAVGTSSSLTARRTAAYTANCLPASGPARSTGTGRYGIPSAPAWRRYRTLQPGWEPPGTKVTGPCMNSSRSSSFQSSSTLCRPARRPMSVPRPWKRCQRRGLAGCR